MKFSILLEALNTDKNFILKIKAMTKKQMVEFIKKIAPYVKNGKINSTELNITEKVDGSSVKISWYNDTINIESSYSGMVSDPNDFKKNPFGEPFAEVLKYYQKTFTKQFRKTFGDKNFKVVGELFYTKDIETDKDGSVTFVATKYNPKMLGKIATVVTFTALEYDGNSFSKPNNKILKQFNNISDKNVTVQTIKELKFQSEINMDVPVLQQILKKPEIILEDKELLETVRAAFIASFGDALKNAKQYEGDLKSIGSVIEGIVLDLGDMQVAYQNPEWQKMHKELWNIPEMMGEIDKEFYFDIIAKRSKVSVKKYLRSNGFDEELRNKLKTAIPVLVKKYNKLKVPKDIPKNLKKGQEKGLKNRMVQVNNLSADSEQSLKQFINMKD
jgi:hypothetical protein